MRPLDVLFLIPARMGSKRFPRKNTIVFDGHPLWKWAEFQAMGAAARLGGACKIVVSTDDPDIAVSYFNGITFRLERPTDLAGDDVTSEAVALHALEKFPADMVCLLQPTSPLRSTLDIIRCVMNCPAMTIDVKKVAANGAVYTQWAESLRKRIMFCSASRLIEMPVERSIDVDKPADLARAQEYLEKYNGPEHQP